MAMASAALATSLVPSLARAEAQPAAPAAATPAMPAVVAPLVIERQKAPAGAEAYIISPADGAVIHGPVVVRFGLKGMGIAPAGIKLDNTGHHHLFVDTDLPANLGLPIPAVDGKVLHFGKGQTEVELTLAPGKHTLQLLVGDYLHIPLDPAVASRKIGITVQP
jgi:hypothetical protein